MEYCKQCGNVLIEKTVAHEGLVPYCEHCERYQFPLANTAVSMILLAPQKDQVLLIKQYGKQDYILVAGYVNQKESLESALYRECKEEIGRKIVAFQYLKSAYYEKTNTLMVNYVAVLDSDSLAAVSDWEIDEATWFPFTEAKNKIKPNSLAQHFLTYFYEQLQQGHVYI